MFTIATAFAAFERALIRERVRSGMDRARKQGTHVGRPRKVNGEWEDVRRRLERGHLTRLEAARALGVSRATVYRLLSQKGSESHAQRSLAEQGLS